MSCRNIRSLCEAGKLVYMCRVHARPTNLHRAHEPTRDQGTSNPLDPTIKPKPLLLLLPPLLLLFLRYGMQHLRQKSTTKVEVKSKVTMCCSLILL